MTHGYDYLIGFRNEISIETPIPKIDNSRENDLSIIISYFIRGSFTFFTMIQRFISYSCRAYRHRIIISRNREYTSSEIDTWHPVYYRIDVSRKRWTTRFIVPYCPSLDSPSILLPFSIFHARNRVDRQSPGIQIIQIKIWWRESMKVFITIRRKGNGGEKKKIGVTECVEKGWQMGVSCLAFIWPSSFQDWIPQNWLRHPVIINL